MGIFSFLGQAAFNLVELKKLDANSDAYIANNCRFNPLMASIHTRVSIYEYIKNLYKSGTHKLNDDEVAMLKLGIYVKEFNRHDYPREYEEIKKCINKLYAKGEDKFSVTAIGEVLSHLTYEADKNPAVVSVGRQAVMQESGTDSPFISCPSCSQKINAPKFRTLEITCPTCGHVWKRLPG